MDVAAATGILQSEEESAGRGTGSGNRLAGRVLMHTRNNRGRDRAGTAAAARQVRVRVRVGDRGRVRNAGRPDWFGYNDRDNEHGQPVFGMRAGHG